MLSWIRSGGFILLSFLTLYLIHRTWPYIYYREPVRQVSADVRVVQVLPEDRTAEVLVGFAEGIDRTNFGYPHFVSASLTKVSAYCDAHADILEHFWRWYDGGGKQAMAPQTQAPMAARFHLFELENAWNPDPLMSAARLSWLLLAQAHRDFGEGRPLEGRRALVATFELGHFHLQNPDQYLAQVGFLILNQAQYYLSEAAPPNQLSSEWLPYLANRDLLRNVWQKVHWVYSQGLQDRAPYLVMGLNQLDDAPYPMLRRFGGGYHLGHTQNLIYDAHQAFCRDIAGPLDDTDFQYYRLAEPVGAFSFNPIGRTFLEMQEMKLTDYIWMKALITARADVLRIRIELADVGLPWEYRHIVAQCEQLGLRNPFTGKAYRVSENGTVEVLPPDDPRWRELRHADWVFTGVAGPAPGLLAQDQPEPAEQPKLLAQP